MIIGSFCFVIGNGIAANTQLFFIDMAVPGDIAMFLFHIFNSIPLLKKAYSMQRDFPVMKMNTQIIIIT